MDDNLALLDYYETLTAARIAAMKGKQHETHVLEFKQVKRDDLSNDDDKHNLARALSGFANAGGGVIVWGVAARKVGQGIDVVTDTPGVQDPRLLVSRLTELTAFTTSPVVLGVRHRVIDGRRHPKFVATYIPESVGGPHMCMMGASANRYYQRSAGSFVPMQHAQVADMFGRRARPQIILEAIRFPAQQYAYTLRISNQGRGAAQAPFLEFNVTPPHQRVSTFGMNVYGLPWVTSHYGSTWLHAGSFDSIIHPTMHVDVCGISLGDHGFAEKVKSLGPACVIRYKLGALGVAPIEDTLTIVLDR